MKQSEIKGLSQEEVAQKLTEVRSSYAEMKRMHAMSPLDNPSQITKTRKTIARLSTALNNNKA